MKLAAAALITAAAALAAPASALASRHLGAAIPAARVAQVQSPTVPAPPIDVASDHTALRAYVAYLKGVLRDEPSGEANDLTFVSTISDQCKSALQPLAQSSSQLDAAAHQTLTVLGEEIGDDLSINFAEAAFPAFSRLSGVLSHLRWTHASGGYGAVRRFINAETDVLELTPSQLCQNALLAASAPHTVPQGSRSFVRSYTRASNAANLALTNLLKLMQTYETESERPILTHIASLAAQITKQTRAALLQSASSLTSTLESS